MNKAAKFWNRITERTDLEDESMPGQTIVEITGFSRVLIENHCGVTSYEKERILVKGRNGCIQIYGQCLILTKMSREVLIIRGNIRQISLQREA